MTVASESFKCKPGLNESVFSSMQKLNPDECCCKCKELHDLDSCGKGHMWNHKTCDCDYNRACKIDEYWDI